MRRSVISTQSAAVALAELKEVEEEEEEEGPVFARPMASLPAGAAAMLAEAAAGGSRSSGEHAVTVAPAEETGVESAAAPAAGSAQDSAQDKV